MSVLKFREISRMQNRLRQATKYTIKLPNSSKLSFALPVTISKNVEIPKKQDYDFYCLSSR